MLKHCTSLNEATHTGRLITARSLPRMKESKRHSIGVVRAKVGFDDLHLTSKALRCRAAMIRLPHLTDMMPSEEEVKFQRNIKVKHLAYGEQESLWRRGLAYICSLNLQISAGVSGRNKESTHIVISHTGGMVFRCVCV